MDNIVAIDGPGASGKSTISKILAKRLGYTYVDTGAMYRALTLKALNQNINVDNEEALINLAKMSKLDITDNSSGGIKVMLDGRDVTSLIRTPRLTKNVSYIAKIKGVRGIMVDNQRRIGERGRCVFEGRDIGTVVFPGAVHKFYLDADLAERAKRRSKELLEKGCAVSYDDVERDLKIRDHKDMTREVAPLKRAEDAIYIDTTDMAIPEVVDKIAGYIK